MPLASKMKVLTSASAPSPGISRPFQRKVTPATLPILAMISRLARTEVWAGAIRVSWLTCWPSAWTEIQDVSWARITRVRDAVVDFAGGGMGLERFRVVTSLFASLPPVEVVFDAAGVAVDAWLAFGEDGAT